MTSHFGTLFVGLSDYLEYTQGRREGMLAGEGGGGNWRFTGGGRLGVAARASLWKWSDCSSVKGRGFHPQENFLKTTSFTLAINVTNTLSSY